MTTYGDWFSGFGGMTIGAKEAGLEVVFGAEYDPKIADVYRQNIGDHIMVCDLLKTPVTAFPRVDVFHASPPCPNFSNAKANAEETERDIALSAKVAEYIVYHLPDIFTMENVYGYRNSQSWRVIAQALHTHGYLFNYWHVNMADYGVPQTRQRMIVIARRDGVMPQLPPATHTAEPQPSLFGTMPRWVSWYEAIEDLIPELPDGKFAPWQIERLPEELKTMFFNDMDMKSTGRQMLGREISEPAATVVASDWRRPSTIPSAYIVNTREMHLSDSGTNYTTRGNDEPVYTLSATSHASRNKAFIMPGGNAINKNYHRMSNEPAVTVADANRPGNAPRAYTNGRVVQMTPRALARFQSFPDWYELPESKKLACKGIGNAVPPLFAEKLYQHLVPDAVKV